MITNILASNYSTLVEYSTYNAKIKGSNPLTDTGIKCGKKCHTLFL
jgi:hypothetical protein